MTDERLDEVELVAAFERAVIEGTNALSTPAHHFRIEALRSNLLAALRAAPAQKPAVCYYHQPCRAHSGMAYYLQATTAYAHAVPAVPRCEICHREQALPPSGQPGKGEK